MKIQGNVIKTVLFIFISYTDFQHSIGGKAESAFEMQIRNKDKMNVAEILGQLCKI